jgi:hypothetical protein
MSDYFTFEIGAVYKINFDARCFTLKLGSPTAGKVYMQHKGDVVTLVEKYRIRNALMLKWIHEGKIIHFYEENMFFARNNDKIEKLI